MLINELQLIFLQIIHNTGRMENNQVIQEADRFLSLTPSVAALHILGLLGKQVGSHLCSKRPRLEIYETRYFVNL